MDEITKKEIDELKQNTRPEVLTPRIVDIMYRSRNSSASYASTGGTRMVSADQMLEFEWNGERYVVPVYKKK